MKKVNNKVFIYVPEGINLIQMKGYDGKNHWKYLCLINHLYEMQLSPINNSGDFIHIKTD